MIPVIMCELSTSTVCSECVYRNTVSFQGLFLGDDGPKVLFMIHNHIYTHMHVEHVQSVRLKLLKTIALLFWTDATIYYI